MLIKTHNHGLYQFVEKHFESVVVADGGGGGGKVFTCMQLIFSSDILPM
jgi:uncharacterized protein (UPF0371 family)